MKMLTITTWALAAVLGLAGTAAAQPTGGPEAKGNAPVKATHTVNDGAAKPGANSFTEGQARKHILKSGYGSITTLTKGQDGVWRGTATKNGALVAIALDYKGNVVEGATAR